MAHQFPCHGRSRVVKGFKLLQTESDSNKPAAPGVHFAVMSRTKTATVVLLILGLGGFALYLNRDWFSKRPIQISHRVSPWLKDSRRGRTRPGPDLGPPVVFSLDGYHRLTSVKVVLASEIETNKYAHPIWELASPSNSLPISSFAYGDRIRGMLPVVKNAQPDPLLPGITYRLLVTTTKESAAHDFTTTRPQPPPP